MDEGKESQKGPGPEDPDRNVIPQDPKLNAIVDAMAEAQAKSAAWKAPAGKKRKGLHPAVPAGLSVVLAGVLAINVALADAPVEVPLEASLRESIYTAALALNAEYEDEGAYPETLEVLGVDEEELNYTPSGPAYTLVAQAEGLRLEYHSGESLAPYRAAFESLVVPTREGQ